MHSFVFFLFAAEWISNFIVIPQNSLAHGVTITEPYDKSDKKIFIGKLCEAIE